MHWADRHYAVGKKQWTWGDDAFGRTWNRNLADGDAVYIELMAGVFTDNQPDFSHLAPGETKTFSQHWYPVAGTGVVVASTLDLALGRRLVDGRTELVLDATRPLGPTRVSVTDTTGTSLYDAELDLNPDQRARISLPTTESVRVLVGPADRPLLRWDPDGGDRGQPSCSPPSSRRRRPRSPPSRSCTWSAGTWSSTGTPPVHPSPTGPRR